VNSDLSTKQIKPFIERFGIKTDLMERKVDDFMSFDIFFCRRLRPSARPISPDLDSISDSTNGRMLAFESIANTISFL
jgi:phosphatidylserine decarboxylase